MLDLSNVVLVKRSSQGPTFLPPSDDESLRIWAHKYGLGHLYATNSLQNFTYEGGESETVKRIEIGLRELADAVLIKMSGTKHYWKRHIPGDVKQNVDD